MFYYIALKFEHPVYTPNWLFLEFWKFQPNFHLWFLYNFQHQKFRQNIKTDLTLLDTGTGQCIYCKYGEQA